MKNTKIFRAIAIALFLTVVLSNCETNISNPNQEKTIENLQVPRSFDWATQKAFTLDLTVSDNAGNVLPNAYVKVYDFDPLDPETEALTDKAKASAPLFEGQTDAQGKMNVEFAVDLTVTKLYVCPAYPSLPNKIEVDVDGKSELSLELGGRQAHKKAESVLMKKVNGEYIYLAGYNALGVPDNLTTPDELDAAFLESVDASLPEGRPVPQYNPEYIAQDTEPNLILTKEAKVWLTFVTEGAGYKNGVGYYTYPVGQEPATTSDISNFIITFPNTSFGHDGKGDMQPGDKVQLMYLNETTGVFEENFPANTVVAWFLVADGWNGSSLNTASSRIVYSTQDFNVESAIDKKRHNVLLYDVNREHLLLGFEDLHRERNTDEDFNDAIFYTKVEPFDAVDPEDLEPVTNPDDEDEEFNNYVDGTLAFEDLWPSKGDYDFNDLVIDYEFNQITNSESKVTQLECEYTVKAIGASFHNGFALSLPINPNLVASVEGAVLTEGYLDVAANGTEEGQSMAVVPFFEDAYEILPHVGGSFVNTIDNGFYSEPTARKITITFTEPIAISTLGVPPYNPFLIINRTDEKRFGEVHLPNQAPTDLANTALFGQDDDRTDVAADRTYLSDKNLPWALNIPVAFEYPYEKEQITSAYLKFANWAESGGSSYADWYMDKASYRNTVYIYGY